MSLVGRTLQIGRRGFRVRAFDLALEPRQTLVVLGPNGAGKSTLLLTLAGLLPPHAGAVIVDGESLGKVGDRRRASLAAYAPPPGEVTAAFDSLTMVELGRVALGGCAPGEALAALERMGARGLARRAFDRLSSGERQLVLLARAFVQGARLCLFDEPTATLDPGRRAAVAHAFSALAEEDRMVIFATHDLDLAATADTILWIDRGGTVETLSAADLSDAAFARRYL